MSAIAAKLPKPRPTCNKLLDTRRSFEHSRFTRLVDKMAKYPKEIQPLHNFMMSDDLMNMNDIEPEAPGEWTGDYRSIDRIPRGWITEYLLWRARSLACDQVLSLNKLQALEESDPDSISMLFAYDTQTVGTMQFPKSLKLKAVATKAFARTADLVGNRLKGLANRGAFGTDDKISFMRGCFDLRFDLEGRCASIEHLPTNEVVNGLPTHISITNKYRLIDNHLDHLARVELLPAKFLLHELFPESARFRKLMVTKKFKGFAELADRCLAEFEQAQQAAADQTVEESEAALEAAKQRRNIANLEQARAKLAERAEKRKQRRTMDLEPLEPAPAPAPAPAPLDN